MQCSELCWLLFLELYILIIVTLIFLASWLGKKFWATPSSVPNRFAKICFLQVPFIWKLVLIKATLNREAEEDHLELQSVNSASGSMRTESSQNRRQLMALVTDNINSCWVGLHILLEHFIIMKLFYWFISRISQRKLWLATFIYIIQTSILFQFEEN